MFESIEGHELIKAYLQKALAEDKMPQTLLFSGIDGIGKKKTAYELAAMLLGVEVRVLEEGKAMDFHFLFPESKSGQHTVEVVKEAMALAQESSFGTGARVFVLEAAERMQPAVSNALLKTLEEPPPDSYWILLSSKPEEILPTIVSRCIRLVFQPLSTQEVVHVLRKLGCAETHALYAHGSVSKALELVKSPEIGEATQKLLSLLYGPVAYSRLAKGLEEIEKLLEVEEPLLYRQRVDHLFSSIALYLRDQELRKTDPASKLLFFPEEKKSSLEWKNWERAHGDAYLGFERNIKLSTCLESFFIAARH